MFLLRISNYETLHDLIRYARHKNEWDGRLHRVFGDYDNKLTDNQIAIKVIVYIIKFWKHDDRLHMTFLCGRYAPWI